MLFKSHYLENNGYKSNIVTKVSLSVDVVELHFLNQCSNYAEAHTYKNIEMDQCVTILEMVVFW